MANSKCQCVVLPILCSGDSLRLCTCGTMLGIASEVVSMIVHKCNVYQPTIIKITQYMSIKSHSGFLLVCAWYSLAIQKTWSTCRRVQKCQLRWDICISLLVSQWYMIDFQYLRSMVQTEKNREVTSRARLLGCSRTNSSVQLWLVQSLVEV